MPNKLGNIFRKMSMASVMNDPYTGAVAQASGWESDPVKGIEQRDPQSKGAQQLAKSLTDISTIPLIDLGLGLAGEAIAGTQLYKGWQLARALNKEVRKGSVPAQVKYYGPTMGKSYASKTNPNLIDLDTWGRPEYDQLAKKYGYKDWREMILSDKGDYNQEYKALIKDQIKRIQSNPQYSGKTIVVSNASFLNPNSGIVFENIPTIPERTVMAKRNNIRHPWESIEHGEQWWDSLQAKGTPLKIDNRFVSEIEGNKVINNSGQTGNILGELEASSEKGWDRRHFKTNTYFGEYLGSGAESDVYQSPFTNNVIKISSGLRSTPNEAVNSSIIYMRDRNKVPFLQKPIERIGIMRFKDKYTPVYKQETVKPLSNVTADEWKDIKSVIDSRMKANGYVKDLSETYKSANGKAIHFWDFKDENFGIDKNGNLFAIDLDIFKQGGILKAQNPQQ